MFSSVLDALGTSGDVDDESLASRGGDWPAAAAAAEPAPEPDTLRGGKMVMPPPGFESSLERVRKRRCRLGCCCSPPSVMVANVTALLGTAEGKANAELGDVDDDVTAELAEAKAASAEGRVVILGS